MALRTGRWKRYRCRRGDSLDVSTKWISFAPFLKVINTMSMDMREYFLKIYKYNLWANRKIMKALLDQDVNDEKILSIFGHLVSAQFIWLNRFRDLPKSPYALWGKYSLEELGFMVEEASRLWLQFIEEHTSFDRVMKYNNYVGDYYENKIGDIMIHLVNHGSYHRGQVALLLRQTGFEPVNTDMITWERVISGQLKDQ